MLRVANIDNLAPILVEYLYFSRYYTDDLAHKPLHFSTYNTDTFNSPENYDTSARSVV